MNELARAVKKLAHSDSEIRHIAYEDAYQPGFEDMERRVPSIAKIQALTGYAPQKDLRSIITRVVDHVRRTHPGIAENVAIR